MPDHFWHGEVILSVYLASLLLLPITGGYLWLSDRITQTVWPPLGWGNALILRFAMSVLALSISVTLISLGGGVGM